MSKHKKAASAAKIHKDSMECNKPRRDIQGGKKSVVKACEDGEEKIVRFGDANMEIKRDNPERRKNFRARHNCDEPKSKLSAGYWSCKAWWSTLSFERSHNSNMAKPKSTTILIESKPKKTCQGDGKHSRPSHGRKLSRGQGK